MLIFKPLWETPHGRATFVKGIPQSCGVLDVGCGNNSPKWFKSIRPDVYYVGIDVADYNQIEAAESHADEYVLCGPEEFVEVIERYRGKMDVVVSSHNIEHCNDPAGVIRAMAEALKPGGGLYLAFPCEESVRFPRRGGCLNFFDDVTHKGPPNWLEILKLLTSYNLQILFKSKRYRPCPLWIKGLLLDPLSAFRREVLTDGSTWAFYGFESVIWATKT